MNVPNSNKGFTIIEVVLVLAIAGLIFLVVFLALPALQRSQRDTQRKSDLGRFMSQVGNYQSNNQGALPANNAAWNTMISNYLTVNGSSFADPDGTSYSIPSGYPTSTLPTSAPAPTTGQLLIYTGAKCDSTAAVGLSASSGSRAFAAVMRQEQGGYYCQSN